jgi:hypothetical protein
MIKRNGSRVLLATGILLGSALAVAAPLPGNLQITGTVSMDTANSLAPTGGAGQTGQLVLTSGGTSTTSSFTGDPATINPASLSGGLTATGDGIGVDFSMSGAFAGAPATTDGLFADYSFALSNLSATETYTITFRAAVQNAVGATGADAFAFSDLSVLDAALIELFFTDHRADTLNPGNNFTLDSPGNVFDITLLPGQSTTLTALQRQRGGVFAAGSYLAALTAFLSIDNVRVSGGGDPNPVPLPGSLPLVALALMALAGASRRRA